MGLIPSSLKKLVEILYELANWKNLGFVKKLQVMYEICALICRVVYNVVIGWIKALFPRFISRARSFAAKERVVLVTGAGSSLGREIAVRFARQGAKVILWDDNAASNEETRKQIMADGGDASPFTVDLSQRQQICETAELVKAQFRNIDVLVNNAGFGTGMNILNCSDDVDKIAARNMNSLFWTAKEFVPKMVEDDHGHVVTITSRDNNSSGSVDDTIRQGAVAFSNALSTELRARSNVHVSVVDSPYADTVVPNTTEPPVNGLFPVVPTSVVAENVVGAVLTNTPIYLSSASNIYLALKGLLPVTSYSAIDDYFCRQPVNNATEQSYISPLPQQA